MTNLVNHDAPEGADVPRYSPQGFAAPIWSDNDIGRDPRRVSKDGRLLLKDRRKEWQRKGLQSWDRTGVHCTSLKGAWD